MGHGASRKTTVGEGGCGTRWIGKVGHSEAGEDRSDISLMGPFANTNSLELRRRQ